MAMDKLLHITIHQNSIDDISELVTVSGYSTSGGNTITLTTTIIKLTSNVNDIYLYKVWKDDALLGVDLGDQASLDAGYITSGLQTFYQSFFQDESIFGVLGVNSGNNPNYIRNSRLGTKT